jgi:hypothetical protein
MSFKYIRLTQYYCSFLLIFQEAEYLKVACEGGYEVSGSENVKTRARGWVLETVFSERIT